SRVVEPCDEDLIFNDLVGGAFTDAEGAFIIEFDRSYFKELFLDRKPDLFFKVFNASKLIKSTEDAVLKNIGSGRKDIVIEADILRNGGVNRAEKKEFMVSCMVLHASGAPVTGAIVRAFDRDLRHEQPLGQAPVGNDGRYGIRYLADQFHNAEKRSVSKALTT